MTYSPQNWQDELLSGEEKYIIKNSAGSTLYDDVKIELKTPVVQAGSDVSAERMNHIEQGIAGASGIPYPAFTRLSVVSGELNPLTDVTGATTAYVLNCDGDTIPIWDGEKFLPVSFAHNFSISLNATYQTAGNVYDIFGFDDDGTRRFGINSQAWASSTSRGTSAAEVETVAGVRVNKNAITLRNGTTTYLVDARKATLVGLISPSVNGQIQWTRAKRELANEYNLMLAGFDVCPGYVDNSQINTWAVTAVSTWTKANGGNGSDATFVLCRPQVPQFAVVTILTGNAFVRVGVAFDGLNVKQSAWLYTAWVTGSSPSNNRGVPLAEGPHTASFCYHATGAATFQADNGNRTGATTDPEETYMVGTILM